ncbi:MAG: hypothetical protein WA941_15780 [Nitrososphaeraceae archaeon]
MSKSTTAAVIPLHKQTKDRIKLRSSWYKIEITAQSRTIKAGNVNN